MVKFLDALPQIFRKRYLETHEKYLKSIADVIVYLYGNRSWKEKCEKMLSRLISAGELGERKIDTEHETTHFRNLRNCWYHESALNYPYGEENMDSRLKFAAWKIIQCYYSIFSAICSLVYSFHKSQKKSHEKILNIYAREFLSHHRRRDFFLPPVNFYLNQQGNLPERFLKMIDWDYAHKYHIPNIIECLEKTSTRRPTLVTVAHYLKNLRDWVSYGDAYLFFRLYGQSPKRNLDFSLQNIVFIHCVQTEFFLIKLFGWEAVKLQYDTFSTQLKNNLKIESPTLEARFLVYSQNFE